MNRKKEKVFAVWAIIFLLLEVVVPIVVLAVLRWGFSESDGIIPIAALIMMVCSVLLGIATIIKKEQVVICFGIVTCVVGTVCMLIFDSTIINKGKPLGCPISVLWITSGYLLLLLLLLATMLCKKGRIQKLGRLLQIAILALLFGNIALNIAIAATEQYVFVYRWGTDEFAYRDVYWDIIYMEIVQVFNSLACVFWGLRVVLRNKALET